MDQQQIDGPTEKCFPTETEVTNQSKKNMQVIEEACRMVLELAILEEEPIEVYIHKLATRVCDTQTKMA